jgi:Protein of unknown function (DUF3341)
MVAKLQRGLVGEFDTHERIVHAARELRTDGFTRLDAHSPYPMRDLENALGYRRSKINWVVFPMGLTAAALAYLLQWWTSAVDYPLNVGGRPAHAAPAFVPITFEMGVLFSALTACITLAVWSKLPALWQPIFEVPGFDRASIDRFFLWIPEDDPAFDAATVSKRLTDLGALRVHPVGPTVGQGKTAWGGHT